MKVMEEFEKAYEEEFTLECLISFLDVLQKGRAKPNTQKNAGQSTVYESLENIPMINAVKERLANILQLRPIDKLRD